MVEENSKFDFGDIPQSGNRYSSSGIVYFQPFGSSTSFGLHEGTIVDCWNLKDEIQFCFVLNIPQADRLAGDIIFGFEGKLILIGPIR